MTKPNDQPKTPVRESRIPVCPGAPSKRSRHVSLTNQNHGGARRRLPFSLWDNYITDSNNDENIANQNPLTTNVTTLHN